MVMESTALKNPGSGVNKRYRDLSPTTLRYSAQQRLIVIVLGALGLTLRSLFSFADYVEIEKMKLGMVIEA